MMRTLRYPGLWWGLGSLGIAVTLWFCLVPRVPQAPGGDKFYHWLAYALLAAGFTALVERRWYGVVAASLLAFSGLIEILQASMNLGRSGEWSDMLANTLGVAVGVAFALLRRESWLSLLEAYLPDRRAR